MKQASVVIILVALVLLSATSAVELAGPPRSFSLLAIKKLGLIPITCKGSLRKPALGGSICARVKNQPRKFQQVWNTQSLIIARRAGVKLIVQDGYAKWKQDRKSVFVRWYMLDGYDFTVFHSPSTALVEFQSDNAFLNPSNSTSLKSRTGSTRAINRGYRCGDYPTHQDAQAAFEAFSIRALDRDHDGLACECNLGGPGIGKPQCR